MDDLVFPSARWGESTVTFAPGSTLPEKRIAAVVVFAIHAEGFVLADIPGRGWCVPSGRPEAAESTLETALRETREEIGADLLDPRPIGVYTLVSDSGERRTVPAFVGRVESLGPLPEGTESRGVRVVQRNEIGNLYWLWDDLMARMFDYALAEFNHGERTR